MRTLLLFGLFLIVADAECKEVDLKHLKCLGRRLILIYYDLILTINSHKFINKNNFCISQFVEQL